MNMSASNFGDDPSDLVEILETDGVAELANGGEVRI